MAEAAQIEEEPRTAEQIEADLTAPTQALSGTDASKILTREESTLKDLETQRALTALNASKRADIAAQSEQAQAPLRDEAVSAMRAREAAGETVAAQPLPVLPQPPKLSSFLDKDTANMMAAAASLIAGFNSNGRVRGIRANSSLAAGITGYMQGNLLRAKLGLEDWQNQVDQQLTEFKLIRQKNLDILNAKNMTIEDKLKEIELANAPYKNQMMQAMIEKEGIDGVVKIDKEMAGIINSMERTLTRANPAIQRITGMEGKILLATRAQGMKTGVEAIDKLTPQNAAIMAGGELMAAPGPEQVAAGGTPKTGEAVLAGVDPGTAALVKKIANYEIPLPSGFALRSPKWMRILDLVAQYDPTFDAKLYNVRMQTQLAYKVKGKPADNIRSLNTAIGHLESLKQAGEDLNNMSIRQLNKWINYGLTELADDPRVKRFDFAANAVAGELSTVFKGTSGTDQEIKSWREELSSSDGPEQIKKEINKGIELLGSRIDVLSQQYKDAMGKDRDFEILHPKSRQILQRIGVDPSKLDPTPGMAMVKEPKVIPGEILVTRKSDGKQGLMKESDFDPAKYTKVPEGQSVRAPSNPMQPGEAAY